MGATRDVNTRNSFDHRGRKTQFPEHVLVQWRDMQLDKTPGTNKRKGEFMTMAMSDGNFELPFSHKDLNHTNIESTKNSNTWIS